eukprot:1153873-Pelagomonas_calceolata.AAC.2
METKSKEGHGGLRLRLWPVPKRVALAFVVNIKTGAKKEGIEGAIHVNRWIKEDSARKLCYMCMIIKG